MIETVARKLAAGDVSIDQLEDPSSESGMRPVAIGRDESGKAAAVLFVSFKQSETRAECIILEYSKGWDAVGQSGTAWQRDAPGESADDSRQGVFLETRVPAYREGMQIAVFAGRNDPHSNEMSRTGEDRERMQSKYSGFFVICAVVREGEQFAV